MCGKRLNSWKQHARLQPHLADLLLVVAASRVKRIGLEAQPVDLDRSYGGLFQEVDAPQQGRLAGPRTAQDHDGLSLPNLEIDAAKNMVFTEVLLDPLGPHDHLAEMRGQDVRVAGFRGRWPLPMVRERLQARQRSDLARRRSSRSWKKLKMIVNVQ